MASREQTNAVDRQQGDEPRGGGRGWRPTRLLGAVTVLIAVAAMVTAGAAPARRTGEMRGRTWTLAPPLNPARADISGLSSVSCPSRRACIAVGSSAATPSSPTLPLAERWNGRRWSTQSIPAPRKTSDVLFGLSCPSTHMCMAVGNAYRDAQRRMTILIETWNGTSWRVLPAPTHPGQSSLYAVSCPSRSSCMAVGFSSGTTNQAIVEHWNGSAWSQQAVPQPAKSTQLLGVSCADPRACTAVGEQSSGTGNARPVAESWNGTQWQVKAVPLPHRAPAGVLEAVSCTSPRGCTATGTDFGTNSPTLAERWNGTRWRVQATPDPANFRNSFGEVALDGVSCTSATACTASGDYSPHGDAAYFIESWNGRGWRLEPAPRPRDFAHGALLAMSCSGARCMAVGAYTGSRRLQVTLAMAG